MCGGTTTDERNCHALSQNDLPVLCVYAYSHSLVDGKPVTHFKGVDFGYLTLEVERDWEGEGKARGCEIMCLFVWRVHVCVYVWMQGRRRDRVRSIYVMHC